MMIQDHETGRIFSLLPTIAMQFHSRDLMLILALFYTAFTTALVTQCRMLRLLGLMYEKNVERGNYGIYQCKIPTLLFFTIANTGPADENLCSE